MSRATRLQAGPSIVCLDEFPYLVTSDSSPHRSRWRTYSTEAKRHLLREHASTVFEDYCRGLFPDAARYWEGDLEFDLVRSDPHSHTERGVIVSEVKWRRLSTPERKRLLKQIEEKWLRSTLRQRYPGVRFEVLDASVLRKPQRDRSPS